MDSFFGIGIWELLLIFVLIMIFVGPKKLPEIATKLGRMYRNLKRASHDLTSELTKEASGTADQKIENPFRKAASELSAELGSIGKSLEVKVDEPKQTDRKTDSKIQEPGKESETQLTKKAGGTADQKIENPLRKVASELGSELSSLVKSLDTKVDEPKQTDRKSDSKT